MKKALVPLADGFEELEAISVIDVLRRGGIEVVTAALGENKTVHGAHGVDVLADHRLKSVLEEEWDAIVLPGGGTGMQNLRACRELLERLRRQKESGALVCAICAAPLVLEAAGVIEEEEVTCYPSCAEEMAHDVTAEDVVADGQLITGSGPGTALMFALVVLRHLTYDEETGTSAAEDVARSMLTEL